MGGRNVREHTARCVSGTRGTRQRRPQNAAPLPEFRTISGMATHPLNAVNRGVYIADNLPFLQALNDECIDLVCIDPPFAKNETFGRRNERATDPLKPPLTEQERDIELALLQRWGARDEAEVNAAGIDWPDTRYKDFWSWVDGRDHWLKDM